MLIAISKDRIDEHIKENERELDNQAEFTKGSKTEYNLLALKYYILSSYG